MNGDSPAPPQFNGLALSAAAWEKLKWFRDYKDVEVCCMGQSDPNDPLFINQLHFIPQYSTMASVEFDNDAQNNYAIDMSKRRLNPDNFMRVWIHTHPGNNTSPSGTDWSTFNDTFGPMEWSVMAILGKSDEFTCVFRVGDEMMNIPVAIHDPFTQQWAEEYASAVLSPQKKTHSFLSPQASEAEWEEVWQQAIEPEESTERQEREDWEAIEMMAIHATNTNSFESALNSRPDINHVLEFGLCRLLHFIFQLLEHGKQTKHIRLRTMCYRWLRGIQTLFLDAPISDTEPDVGDLAFKSPFALAHHLDGNTNPESIKPLIEFDEEYFDFDAGEAHDDAIIQDYPAMLVSDKLEERSVAFYEALARSMYVDIDFGNLFDAEVIELYNDAQSPYPEE